MVLRLLWLCWLAAPAYGQQDWTKLLERVRNRVGETIQRLPNYLCTETVDRIQYGPIGAHVPACATLVAGQNGRRPRPITSDRLRLDVAVSKTGEMYSWVGESGFHDQSLGDLVKVGATSTGSFAAFLRAIFASDGVSFSFKREKTESGKRLAEFAFHVSKKDSQYSFGYRTGHVMTGYSGTFLVDSESADLMRLVIDTDELPDYTESCQASTTLDYRRVVLHASDFLLPSESRLRIIDTNGTESENRTVFSACHEFLGESTLSFDNSLEESSSAAGKGAVAQTPLPAGLAFQLALTEDIDAATAAAGDPMHARLATAIQDHSSKVLVPVGAVVNGRITEMRRYYAPSPSWSIVLRLESVKADGRLRPFVAVVDTIGQRLTGSRGSKGGLHWNATPGMAALVFEELKPAEVIKGGQEMKWVTVARSQAGPPKVESPAGAAPQTNPMPSQFRLEEPVPDHDAGNRPGFVPADALAPTGPQNIGFTTGAAGEVPPGWRVPTRSAGYSAELRSAGCKIGPMCAVVLVPRHPPANSFGNLMQSFDATPYRGKTIRLHGWLRVEPAEHGNRAQLWVRVDRENGQVGFFENMGGRPVTSADWKECEIRGRVDHDASFINIGAMALGRGAVWIDGIDFEVVPPSERR